MLTLEPRRVRTVLLGVVAILIVLSLMAQSARRWAPGSPTAHALAFFNVGYEVTVPSFFSALMLLACAALAGAIAATRARLAGRWWILAAVLLALSVDEAIAFHEATIKPLRRLLDAGGVLYFTWIVPGVGFVLVACGAFRALLTDLSRQQARLLLMAVALYFAGALGLEATEGWVVDRHGMDSLALQPLIGVEEALEMTGVVLFMYVLMDRLAPWAGTLRLSPR